MSDEKQPNEADIIFNCSKTLLEIGQALEPIDNRLSEFSLFLADRVLAIGEEKGYNVQEQNQQQNTTCQSPDCSCVENEHPKTPMKTEEDDAEVITVDNQVTRCVGHTNDPGMQPKPLDDSVQGEVRSLVEKIRSESSNAQRR
jgi:hypothetical protein